MYNLAETEHIWNLENSEVRLKTPNFKDPTPLNSKVRTVETWEIQSCRN